MLMHLSPRVYRHDALRCDYRESFKERPSPRVEINFFDTDMMKNVWMPPHNRLQDSVIIDHALNKFAAFVAFFNFGAEFRANFARSGQSLRQLVVGRNPGAVIVPATM